MVEQVVGCLGAFAGFYGRSRTSSNLLGYTFLLAVSTIN